jgi:hypothetical protein
MENHTNLLLKRNLNNVLCQVEQIKKMNFLFKEKFCK